MSKRSSLALAGISATLLICLGAPNPGLHLYPAALVALAPLFWIGWQHLGRRQIAVIVGIWLLSCGIVLAPDFRSVQWLSPLEIGVGILGYLLLPWILMGATFLGLGLTHGCPPGIRPLAIAGVWVGWDLFWAWIRFPIPLHWGALLYDWTWGIQIADGVGIWGVTFYSIVTNATFALLVHPHLNARAKRRGAGIWLCLTLVVLSYGGVRLEQMEQLMAEGQGFQVAAIQPVAWLQRDRSWDYRLRQYQQLFRLSTEGVNQGAQLVVWPEGSLRAPLRDTPLESFLIEPVTALLPEKGALLLGTTEPDPTPPARPPQYRRYHNVSLLYDSEAQLIGQSGKRWIFPLFESQRHQPYGEAYRPLSAPGLGSIGVMICLESVLPGPSLELVQQGAESLIVLADDSSFGKSNWLALHAALSVFRAVETRRSLVFVNNTGQSLIVTPAGVIHSQGPLFQPAMITGPVIRHDQITLFTTLAHRQ